MAIDESVAQCSRRGAADHVPDRGLIVSTPKQVIERAKELGVQMVDIRFTDLLGAWQHFSVPLGELDEDASRMASGSMAPASAASRRSTRATCSCSRTRRTFLDPCGGADPAIVCDIVDPLTREPYSRTRVSGPKGRGVSAKHGIADTSTWVPRRSSTSSTRSVRPEHPERLLLHRLRRGRSGTRAEGNRRTSVTGPREGRILPRAPGRQAAGPPQPRSS